MIHAKQHLSDGSVVVVDDQDRAEFVLKPEQWAHLGHVPTEEQRVFVERAVLDNRTAGDPRSAADQQAIETAQNASTGEAHQEGERGS